MNHTTNYNLNQWEALDKVQRTDFNADNAKIDAAIHAVDGRVDGLAGSKADKAALNTLAQTVAGLGDTAKLHTIKEIKFAANATSASVSLRDIDWTQWKIIVTVIRAQMDTGTCHLYPRGSVDDNTAMSSGNDFVIVQFPMYRNDLPFMGLLLSNNGKVFSFGTSCQTAWGFQLSPLTSQTIPSGSAAVYGMK